MKDEPKFGLRVRALITEASKILLVKERDEENWETPGGGLQDNELVEEALKREIKEELGMEIEIGNIVDAVLYNFPNGTRFIHLIYRAKILKKIGEPKSDIEDVKWFDKKNIQKMLEEEKVDYHDKKVFEDFLKK